MAGRFSPVPHTTDPQERRIRRAWRLLVGSFVALSLVALVGLLLEPPSFVRGLVAVLVVVTAAAALVHRRELRALAETQRGEVESFARILQGLSRSVSPDAIVEAIVEELGEVSGADHVVVVRLRPNSGLLEATLVTTRVGVPSSTTILPLSDLDDPGDGRDGPGADGGRGGEPARVPVGPGRADDEEVMVAEDDRVVRLGSRRRQAGAAPEARLGAARPAAQRVADRLARRVGVVFGLRNTMVAPLETPGGVVGAIVLSRRTSEAWPSAAGRLLTGAAVEASAALARAYSHRAAEEQASTDPLTGLPNRRYFEEVCGLFTRRRRAGDAVGILMIDIDRFKALNDRHGHAIGDEVLRAVARAIVSAVREDDVPARYGGEEFVVLLRNPAPGVSIEVGERVRAAVRGLDLSGIGVPAVSVSVGVAVASSEDERIADLIEGADRALYRAKRAGRDRVVAA